MYFFGYKYNLQRRYFNNIAKILQYGSNTLYFLIVFNINQNCEYNISTFHMDANLVFDEIIYKIIVCCCTNYLLLCIVYIQSFYIDKVLMIPKKSFN